MISKLVCWAAALMPALTAQVETSPPSVVDPALSADVARLDALLDEAWRRRGLQPAPPCTDEEFLRRATLDLIGRIPTLDEARRFSRHPDRAAKVDELLASDAFPRFWSEVWTALLTGYGESFGANRGALRAWLENAFRERRPYDEMAAQLVTATVIV